MAALTEHCRPALAMSTRASCQTPVSPREMSPATRALWPQPQQKLTSTEGLYLVSQSLGSTSQQASGATRTPEFATHPCQYMQLTPTPRGREAQAEMKADAAALSQRLQAFATSEQCTGGRVDAMLRSEVRPGSGEEGRDGSTGRLESSSRLIPSDTSELGASIGLDSAAVKTATEQCQDSPLLAAWSDIPDLSHLALTVSVQQTCRDSPVLPPRSGMADLSNLGLTENLLQSCRESRQPATYLAHMRKEAALAASERHELVCRW